MVITEDKNIWGIHTQDDNLFLKQDVIAIGWHEMGDLRLIEPTREAFKAKYEQVYPDAKKGGIGTSAGMLYRFVHSINVGDYVVYPSKKDRHVNIGVVEGEYYYDPSHDDYVQQRKVKWLKHLPRKYFPQGALYELGSALSLFSIKNYADDFLEALHGKVTINEEDDTVQTTAEDIIFLTKDFITKQLSKHLKGFEFELFVADLLNAMGYRTIVSNQGGDSGIDIIAYQDELPPRILVQVKSIDNNISETVIQSLKGAMREGDYGLFVTLSDFSKNANKYLEATPIIRGINGLELVELVIKHYDQLSEKHKKIIPLKMVYIPVSTIEE